MADITFSLANLFDEIFSNKGKNAFEPAFGIVVDEKDRGNDGLLRKEYGNVASSPFYAKNAALGVEYYLPVTISFPDESGTQGRLLSWDLPFPKISVRGKKTIIETPLTQRRGTVKELINIQDYEIFIRGKMISKSKEFPETALQQLVSVYELSVPVRISSPISDVFLVRPDRSGSDQAVITSLNFPEGTGAKNVRDYEITLLSDEPFNLIDIG